MKSGCFGLRVVFRGLGIFVLLFVTSAAEIWPQKAPEAGRPAYWWLGASVGAGSISGGSSEGLVLGHLDLTVQKGKMFIALRGTYAVNPSDDRTSVSEIDLVVGYFKRQVKSAWSFGAGIGYVDMYPPSKPPYKGLAVPLEIRYAWSFSRSAALTVGGLLSFSRGASSFGVTAGIQLGRVRPR